MSSKKAKIVWANVCKPREEGGLGLRSLEETNKVCCLKLIWRLLSGDSLWVRWVHRYLIRKGSFWTANDKSSLGSWIWKKLLKYRNLGTSLTRIEIRSGTTTSFWYDQWSQLGRIIDITVPRGSIDLGIPMTATVEFAVQVYRSRMHRVGSLIEIENEILKIRMQGLSTDNDSRLWKGQGGSFEPRFSTSETWQLTRVQSPRVNWCQAVWFQGATPKYSFLTWIAVHDCLATGVRVQKWSPNSDAHCVFCTSQLETRKHLFFCCPYSKQIWKGLTTNLLCSRYTEDWNGILNLLVDNGRNKTEMFLPRYVFQCSVHTIWRERNGRKHGEGHQSAEALLKIIDKGVRNRISSLRVNGSRCYATAMASWFATRE